MDESGQEQQAHAMCHPGAVEGGVQHVSDAAAPVFIEDLSAWETHADAEMVAQRIGVVVRTAAEWNDMEAAARDYWTIRGEADVLRSQLAAKTAECERLTVQLAGCGVGAMGNTRAALAQAAKPGDYGWSASYGDVLRAVEQEVALREQVEQLGQAVGLLTTLHPTMEINAHDPVGMAHRIVEYVNERLREGREDGAALQARVEAVSAGATQGTGQALLAVDPSQSLDHRLGVQQPAGEPGTVTAYWKRSGV